MLAEHYEALNYKRKHPPRTPDVRLAANGEPRAIFVKDCHCASAIACVGHLAKQRSLGQSMNGARPWIGA
jgi:hypothetical protein